MKTPWNDLCDRMIKEILEESGATDLPEAPRLSLEELYKKLVDGSKP